MRGREEKEKRRYNARYVLIALLVLILGSTFVSAQEPGPTPEPSTDAAKECTDLQKTLDDYADETARIKLTLSFQSNSSYWQGAAAELNFGIARRRIITNLQAIAYKLGVKRLKDWDIVTQEEKLAYQKRVSQTLDREMGRAITVDRPALESRLVEIDRLLKPVLLKHRDLGCVDILRDLARPPVQQPR